MKEFDKYQAFTTRTAKYRYTKGKEVVAHDLTYPALGLNGEAGEVAEKVKKLIRDKGGVCCDDDRLAVARELGDVMWYVAQTAARLNMKLSDVARLNVEKLTDRKKRGALHGSGDDR